FASHARCSASRSPAGVGDDPAPEALGAPDPAPQALELNDLRVVDEQVDLGPVVLDIPAEHLGVCGLEHHLLQAELPGDRSDDVGTPGRDLLGDSLGLDHDHVGARVQAAAREVDRVADVAGPLLREFLRRGRTARAELDADLRLGLQAGALDTL